MALALCVRKIWVFESEVLDDARAIAYADPEYKTLERIVEKARSV